MEWMWLVLTALAWFFGVSILLSGLRLTKESHNEKSLLDHSKNLPSLGDFSLFGFIFDIISSLIFGVFMKYSPWWLAKTFLILLACLFFYLGALAIMKL
ncbi:MAG: hypothetical protein JWM44_4090 [Bacilli bacterium]|nr:hypothetical protein [Bacilli bacterium]